MLTPDVMTQGTEAQVGRAMFTPDMSRQRPRGNWCLSTSALCHLGDTSHPALLAWAHVVFAELLTAAQDEASHDLVQQAQRALERDLRLPIDLAALAKSLGVSYDRLRRSFHARWGVSPGQWRLQRRLERAKELLTMGTPIEQAAADLGFCDRFQFARQFRNATGSPPGRWQRGLTNDAHRDRNASSPA